MILLRGTSTLLAGVGTLRRRAYQAGWLAAHRVSVPVVSVGALRSGGSGKTPVAAFIAERLSARARVGLLHSGYGGTLRGCAVVTAGADGLLHGDEAVLHARRLSPLRGVVVRGRDRVAAAALAVEAGAEVLVLDDGFQHLRLYRDLDILMAEPSRDVESWADLARELPVEGAELSWCHHREPPSLPSYGRVALTRPERKQADLRETGLRQPEPRSHTGPEQIVSELEASAVISAGAQPDRSPTELRGARVYLLAAVARPEAFRRTVEGLGAQVVGQRFRRDHHPLSRRCLRIAGRSGADLVLCTEKDLARQGRALGDLWALRCDVRLRTGAAELQRRLERVSC